LVALVGGPAVIGLVFLVGALLPSAGPGTAGPAEASPVTLSAVLSWLAVGLTVLLTTGGWDLGAKTPEAEDRTWAIGSVAVGGLAILGSLGIAIGRTTAPQIAWDTIAAAGGPIVGGLLIVLALLTAERLRLIGDLPAAKRCDRSPWGLGLGSLLLLDQLLPEGASISGVFGSAASMVSLFLIAAGIYGCVLLGAGLARLTRDDGGVADLGANDG